MLESLVDLLESLVDLLESLVDLLESFVDLLKPTVDLRELFVNFPEPLVNFSEPIANFPELLVNFSEPFANIPEPLPILLSFLLKRASQRADGLDQVADHDLHAIKSLLQTVHKTTTKSNVCSHFTISGGKCQSVAGDKLQIFSENAAKRDFLQTVSVADCGGALRPARPLAPVTHFRKDAVNLDFSGGNEPAWTVYPLFEARVNNDDNVDSLTIAYGFLDADRLLFVSAGDHPVTGDLTYRVQNLHIRTGETGVLFPDIPGAPMDEFFAGGWLTEDKSRLVLNTNQSGKLWTFDLVFSPTTSSRTPKTTPQWPDRPAHAPQAPRRRRQVKPWHSLRGAIGEIYYIIY